MRQPIRYSVAIILLASAAWSGASYLLLHTLPYQGAPAEQPAITPVFATLATALILALVLFVGLNRFQRPATHASLLKPYQQIALYTTLAYLLSALASNWIISLEHQQEVAGKRLAALNMAASRADTLQAQVAHAVTAVSALAALISAYPEDEQRIPPVARHLLEGIPGSASLQVAPRGVVTLSVTKHESTPGLGTHLLTDPSRSGAAWEALGTRSLALTGPFAHPVSGQVIVADLPVFLEDTRLWGERFWGFASALIPLDALLQQAQLPQLAIQGYRWRLARPGPAATSWERFAGDRERMKHPVLHNVQMPHQQWRLELEPRGGWVHAADFGTDGVLEGVMVFTLTLLAFIGLYHPQVLSRQVEARTLKLNQAHDKLHQAHEKLQEREALLAETQRLAQTGSWQLDLTGNTLEWSAETYTLFGMQPAQTVTLEQFRQRIYPDDRALLETAWQEGLASGRYEVEHRIVAGQRIRWVREIGRISYDQTDRPVKAVGAVRDITQDKENERLQQESEERLELALSGAELGLWDFNFVTHEVRYNERWAGMLGYRLEELDQSVAQWQRLIHPDDRQRVLALLDQHLRGDSPVFQADHRLQARAGGWRWIHTKGKVVEWDRNGHPVRALGTHLDITERKRAELQLRRLSQAIEHSPAATIITTTEPKIIYVNPSFCAASGYSPAEVLGQNPGMLKSGQTPEETYRQLWSTISAGRVWKGELLNRKKNGELMLEKIAIAPVMNDDKKIVNYVAVREDITERRAMEQTIWKQANYDPLTGLVNRTYFHELLHAALSRAQRSGHPVGLLFIDLDNFKPVNDTYGHQAGDLLLKQFAQRLRHLVRDTDTVARLGGDEFMVIIEDLQSPLSAETLTAKLHAPLLESPYRINLQKPAEQTLNLSVRASIGYALYPEDAGDAERLIACADSAMYTAKQRRATTVVRFSTTDDPG